MTLAVKGSSVSGFRAANGHLATTAETVGTRPFCFIAMALAAMAFSCVLVMVFGLPICFRSVSDLPGYQSASALNFSLYILKQNTRERERERETSRKEDRERDKEKENRKKGKEKDKGEGRAEDWRESVAETRETYHADENEKEKETGSKDEGRAATKTRERERQ